MDARGDRSGGDQQGGSAAREKGLAVCAVTSDSGRPGRRRMDWDPELDVTLSNGRRVLTFQIATVAGAREAWAFSNRGHCAA